MTSIASISSLLDLLGSGKTRTSSVTNLASSALVGSDFSSALKLRLAELQSGAFSQFLGESNPTSRATSALDFLSNTVEATATTSLPGLSAGGYNLSLLDPVSAFTMMSKVNTLDVTYKAQFAELSEMKEAVTSLDTAGKTLGDTVDPTSDDAAIKAQLQKFTDQYNAWIKEFDATVQTGGVLNGTQAAEVTLSELRQAVENRFNGAATGFNGLADLGLTIDPTTHLATLDTNRLNNALANNRNGVVETLDQFSANFVKSADLLTSGNNFLENRLSNLDRVIDYLTANKTSLQTEFGTGAPPKISDGIAAALAIYNKTFAL